MNTEYKTSKQIVEEVNKSVRFYSALSYAGVIIATYLVIQAIRWTWSI